jgi:signal transduction histidine kinase/Flp pilus assembly protein TadD
MLFIHWAADAQSQPTSFRNELKAATTDAQKLNIYGKIFAYYKNSNSDSARYYLESGLEAFSKDHYVKGRAVLLAMLSGTYSEQGLTALATNAGTEALRLFTEMNDETGMAKAHNALGVIDGRKGHYDAAIRHFLSALGYFEKAGDTVNIINTYVKLGTANDFAGNFEQALTYYNKGLELALKIGETANAAYLYNNLGSMYLNKKDYDKALIQLQKALKISEKPQFAQTRIVPLMNIGNIYSEKGEPGKAIGYYKEALELSRAAGLKEEIGHALHSIGTLEALQLHLPTTALDEALKVARELDNKALQLSILKDMTEVAHVKRNYEEEVRLLTQQSVIRDSLFDIDKAREIANLQSEYELNKTNTQLAALKLSEQKNLKQKDLIISIAVVLAVTLITLLFFFIRNSKLHRAVLVRGQELLTANAIKDRLFAIIGHDLRGPIANIPALLDIYKSQESTDEMKTYILDALEENSEASLETLEKLLNWGNLQIKGSTLNMTLFTVGQTIDNTMRLLRVAANNKGIVTVNGVPDDTVVYADENHFKFILRNLFSNAVKYTRDGGLIEVGTEANSGNDHVTFFVKDNGVGIDREMLEKIFEPDNTSIAGTAQELGTSIGLMLCREFVTQNGGNIWVESEKDQGSTFYFTVLSGVSTTVETDNLQSSMRRAG